MRTISFLLRKEFLQIFRNKPMLAIIFVLPIVQLLVLSFAATFDVRTTSMALFDQDRTYASTRLVERFEASGYFHLTERAFDARRADEAMMRDDADMILRIPANFERDLARMGRSEVHITLDAVDGATAGVVQAYALQILAASGEDSGRVGPRIEVLPAFWFNPNMDYKTYMVPGILVILVTMIGTFLTSMNIVREKETGTIEQLNVTPIRRWHFIVGKLMPFWLIAMCELAAGLVIARIVFDVPMLGNLALVFLLAGIYMLAMLGVGLYVSTRADTQQQAMFLAWFIMVICILMSGLFTPIESMPDWAQAITKFNPVAHFIEIMRRVLLKGSDFAGIRDEFWILTAFACGILTLAVRQYRKVST